MKRIALSLFVITAIVSVGVYATGAYFTDSISANNYTFTAGSAGLKFGFCPGLNTDCSTTSASLDNYTFSTAQATGPGITAEDCIVVENVGDFALTLTALQQVTYASPDGMQDAFQVYAETTDHSCEPGTGSAIYSWQSARSAASAGNVPVGSLAAHARLYIIQKNAWDSTGNQNALQGGTLKINATITGQTV
jgi:hypothetical protein